MLEFGTISARFFGQGHQFESPIEVAIVVGSDIDMAADRGAFIDQSQSLNLFLAVCRRWIPRMSESAPSRLFTLVTVVGCGVAYSAFFNTQLDWVLRKAGIDTVAVCGIVTRPRFFFPPRSGSQVRFRTAAA